MIATIGQRFGPQRVPYNETISQLESIEFLHRIGASAVSFHTRTEASPKNIEALAENLHSRQMNFGSIFANVFSEVPFRYGGVTSPIPAAQRLALLRKMEGFLWDVKYGCPFQTDWLGEDGTFLFNLRTPRDEALVQYNMAMLLFTGAAVKMAKEFKPGDPAEEMAETNAPTCILQAEDTEKRIRDLITADVLAKIGGDTSYKLVTAEVNKRFAPYDHAMGVNIEDAHVLLQPYQTVAGAAEMCIARNRLIHRHPNDTKGQVDNDLVFGVIHLQDAIKTCYVERKAGLHNKITYEPDLFPVKEDVLVMYLESVNMINYCHAVAQKLIKWEKKMGIESVYELAPARMQEVIFEAMRKLKNFKRIDTSAVVSEYRKEIGKPILFAPSGYYASLPSADLAKRAK